MPLYRFVVPVRRETEPEQRIAAIKEKLVNLAPLLDKAVDEVILPALEGNYDASGLKTRSGVLKRGITKRGALGNYVITTPAGVTVGVSYAALPYAKYALEGRGPVSAKRAKSLRFADDNGKVVFRKRVGPAPPHQVYELHPADEEKIARALGADVVGKD